MKRIIVALVAAVVSTATLTACNESNASDKVNTTEVAAPKADNKVEVIYFHGKRRLSATNSLLHSNGSACAHRGMDLSL